MEGYLAKLDQLIGKHSGDLEATLRKLGSGGNSLELCSDPAYFKYYGFKVELNQSFLHHTFQNRVDD
jgi:hypothetical protein